MHRRHVRIQQALEGSMHTMGRDIRMAGLGFGRTCSELRIWDAALNRPINPGSFDAADLGDVTVDAITNEPYWVLRDGIQAHWRSGAADGANSINGTQDTSASPTSQADSFDVILGERNYTASAGILSFLRVEDGGAADATLVVKSKDTVLDSGDNTDLAAVRQLFPPGSFITVAADPAGGMDVFRPEFQRQCAVLQVTGEVVAGDDSAEFAIPISNVAGFNADPNTLLGIGVESFPTDADTADPEGFGNDWGEDPIQEGAAVVPLGRLRWSRYEIDYTVPQRPYLVRSDIIGVGPNSPADVNVATAYPSCPGNVCTMPALHLPTANNPAPRTAVGPMIEDMQVAVGCDGMDNTNPIPEQYTLLRHPEAGFEEKGPKTGGGNDLVPNRMVDEWDLVDERDNDEWVGNAQVEQWAPDCVYWGTGERLRDQWPVNGPASEQKVAPGYHISPQVVRVTLLAKSETRDLAGENINVDDFYNQLFEIEDRPQTNTVVGARSYETLTERFSPRNLHWRPADIP
jgi:hypothetical protein